MTDPAATIRPLARRLVSRLGTRGVARAAVLAAAAALAAAPALLLTGSGVPARANGGPTCPGGSETPMVVEFLVDAVRTKAVLTLGSATEDPGATVRVRVDWGDGTTSDVTGPVFPSHTYTDGPGTKTVTICPLYDVAAGGSPTGPWLSVYGADADGSYGSWRYNGYGDTADGDDADVARMTGVVSFGDLGIVSLRNAFNRHHLLTAVPTTLPTTVRDLSYAFYRSTTTTLTGIASWDVSRVTAMRHMFDEASGFNEAIGGWNVSSVTDMEAMFQDAAAFNQPIGGWDVSSVTDMEDMFEDAHAFNQPLATWDVSNVTTMEDMFENAFSFDQPIGSWNVAKVTTMNEMFDGATVFNQPLATWNVGSVIDMSDMFRGATAFDQPLATWNVANVTAMDGMFRGATAFNQPLATWNVANVTAMDGMFRGATAFDQPLATWNVANVTAMNGMFLDATAFDRSLGAWSLEAEVSLSAMLDGAGMSSSCYDATLVGWAAQAPAVTGRSLGALGRQYSPVSTAARAVLVDDRGWTIGGDTEVDVATGRCASGGGEPAPTAARSGVGVACSPADPAIGATVSCTVSGGDPDVDVLWRAAAGGTAFDEAPVRLGPDGTGTFTFTVPRSALGQPLSVELVAWTGPIALGTVGAPLPSVIAAGDGPWSVAGLRQDGVLRLAGALVLAGAAAAAVAAAVAGQRRVRRRAG